MALIEENERKQSKVILQEADKEWQSHVDSMQNHLNSEHAKSIQTINDKHNSALLEVNTAYTDMVEKLKSSETYSNELEVELKVIENIIILNYNIYTFIHFIF